MRARQPFSSWGVGTATSRQLYIVPSKMWTTAAMNGIQLKMRARQIALSVPTRYWSICIRVMEGSVGLVGNWNQELGIGSTRQAALPPTSLHVSWTNHTACLDENEECCSQHIVIYAGLPLLGILSAIEFSPLILVISLAQFRLI